LNDKVAGEIWLSLFKTTECLGRSIKKQTIMINPDDQIPLDDAESQEDEQTSQQDIHSNGFDDDELISENTEDESDALAQAYEASEPSYTLNLDGDDNTDDDE
jgi:hypothetical protein